MFYYLVPAVGDGTANNTYRPDVPVGTSFAGNKGSDGNYLISTPHPLPMINPLSDAELQNECWLRELVYDDVVRWFVAG